MIASRKTLLHSKRIETLRGRGGRERPRDAGRKTLLHSKRIETGEVGNSTRLAVQVGKLSSILRGLKPREEIRHDVQRAKVVGKLSSTLRGLKRLACLQHACDSQRLLLAEQGGRSRKTLLHSKRIETRRRAAWRPALTCVSENSPPF